MLKSYPMRQGTIDIVKKLRLMFEEKGTILSTAESCTGGLISHYITAVDGASNWFTGGVVTYSLDMKKKVLGVSSETVKTHGVVSEAIAREMAQKAISLSGSDYSVSSTGNLGPDVLEGKKKGLVYVAAAGKDRMLSKELHLEGDRETNKEEAVFEGLKLLMEFMEEEGSS